MEDIVIGNTYWLIKVKFVKDKATFVKGSSWYTYKGPMEFKAIETVGKDDKNAVGIYRTSVKFENCSNKLFPKTLWTPIRNIKEITDNDVKDVVKCDEAFLIISDTYEEAVERWNLIIRNRADYIMNKVSNNIKEASKSLIVN